jgi:hypothetical protein
LFEKGGAKITAFFLNPKSVQLFLQHFKNPGQPCPGLNANISLKA